MNKPFFCQTCNSVIEDGTIPHLFIAQVFLIKEVIPNGREGEVFFIKICLACANFTKRNMAELQDRQDPRKEIEK